MCSLVGNLVCTEFVKGLQGFDTVWCVFEYVLVYILFGLHLHCLYAVLLVCTEFVKGLQGFDTVWCMFKHVG